MDAREERGLIIAATCRLNRISDGTWFVPIQTRAGQVAAYRVYLEAKTCAGLDHVEGGNTCKHDYAASIVHKRDVLPDGTVIETRSLTLTEKKVYKQDWPKYNAAQATEKRRFRVLLHDLCRRLSARVRAGDWLGGRQPDVSDSGAGSAWHRTGVLEGRNGNRSGRTARRVSSPTNLVRSSRPAPRLSERVSSDCDAPSRVSSSAGQ
jgi:hypothetical protein